MKTKQEVIQSAWAENWDLLFDSERDHALKNDGWIPNIGLKLINKITFDFKEMHIIFGSPEQWIRPQSLAGLETNNGWIRIESEDWLKTVDREKGVTFYYVNSPDEDYFDIAIQLDDKEKSIVRLSDYLFMLEELNKSNIKATHYQPINKIPSAIY